MGKDNDTPAPAPPDPFKTAEAQGQMNQNTAISQQLLNMTNQVTPYGSLTYNQTGTNTFTGADGKQYSIPQFTATQTLTPQQQALLDTNNVTQQNLANAGQTASSKIGDILGSNVNLNNDEVENRLFELGSKRLTPQFQRDENALRTQLINSGIRPGTEAWNTEMTRLAQNKNDAMNQLLLGGRQQAISEILTERNQPLNEITALMSGSQVSQPNFTSTPQTSVAGVDYAGMVQNNYNNQMRAWEQQQENNNAAMGGMFGLGGTLGGAALRYGLPLMMSDRRLKSDIVLVGKLENGLPLYEYTIFGERQRGVMADEVAQVMPDAVVTHPTGFQMVNYDLMGAA